MNDKSISNAALQKTKKGYKARLYPTKEQEIILSKIFGACRYIYNHFLSVRRTSYKDEGVSLGYVQTNLALTLLKRDKDHLWLNECDSMALQETLRNLDRAFQNFFSKRGRYPRFHSKHGNQSYRTRNQQGSIRIEGHKVRIPKVGLVRFRGLKPFDGRILNATVSKTPSGKYFVSLCVEEDDVILSNDGGVIGIDVGLKEFYTDSNNQVVEFQGSYRKHERKLIREQRRLSRRVKGSSNRNKQRLKVALIHERIANIRRDFLHKETTKLAIENQVVCVEDLHVKGMLRNHRLAKSISDASWSEFFRMLEYKTREHGGVLVRVPTFYPSSQTCSCCGYKNPLVKDLKVRSWVCPECGSSHERDHNAAINILGKGLEMLASA